MEIFKKIENVISVYRERIKANEELMRIERISNHPHKPECTGSGDIQIIDSTYFPPEGAFGPSLFIVYKTQCSECGEIKDRS